MFQEGRSGKSCQELRRCEWARAPLDVATWHSGVNAAEASSADPWEEKPGWAGGGRHGGKKEAWQCGHHPWTDRRQCVSVPGSTESPCASGPAKEISGIHDP